MRVRTFFALLSLVASILIAQAPPKLSDAGAKLQANDFAGALNILQQVTMNEPQNNRAWRMRGFAEIKLKEFDHALASYAKVLALEPDNTAALYNSGVAAALKGDKDAAFEWLQRAKKTRKIDMTQISGDNDLVSLKDDPRFASLLPTKDDFANPFVEPVKIIREWDGAAAGDQFGWIARNIGDVDGDRIADVVTSAPTALNGAGRVYVYSSRSGKLLWSVDGKAGDQLGYLIEAAGDTNRDGIPDVIAGAPAGSKAFIYSGKDGHLLQAFVGEKSDDSFGHVAGAGDVNRDGYADVIIGAPNNDTAGADAGRVYVYSGKDGQLLATFDGERAGDNFGNTVGGAVGSKQITLIIGASKGGAKNSGRTYVYNTLKPQPKFVIDADDTGSALGAMFISVLGDVDGDHVADIYASDWSNNAKGPSTGRIYVHSGKSGQRLLTLTGETVGEGFGIGTATAGDVNRDGRADLVIGSWQYAGAATSGGRVYLYSGKDGKLLKSFTCRIPGDTFGFDAVGLGDVDGDGKIDLLLTSAWSGISGYHSGRVFVISSGV